MKISFTKMHLLGNDFVLINGIKQRFNPDTSLINAWSSRHRGIGFDQLLVIEKPQKEKTHFHYRIFNANGNEVTQCGNGALCIPVFLSSEKLLSENPICVSTKTNSLALDLKENNHVTANLGMPIFDPKQIPFIHVSKGPFYTLETSFGNFDACVLSLGNPHCVITVDNLEKAPVDEIGVYLNQSAYFPEGTNVEFINIKNPKQIALRVYERGVGKTQACGSGACAAVMAGRLLKQLNSDVTVQFGGGNLKVNWQNEQSPVFLSGKGEIVFKGRI